MKKVTAFLIVLFLLVSLTACGQSNPVSDPGSAGSHTFANDKCSIDITGLEYDQFFGYSMNVTLENKTKDQTLMFTTDYAAVNGVDVNCILYDEVEPGQTLDTTISFWDSSLDESLIGPISDFELTFRVYDVHGDFGQEPVALQTVHYYPDGEAKATRYVRQTQSTDKVLVEDENVSLIVTGIEPDGSFGYSVHMYLANKTDKALMFSVEESYVNGISLNPLFASTVPAGKCKFVEVEWLPSKFEENGITEVESLEVYFTVYENGNWSSDSAYVDETFSIVP